MQVNQKQLNRLKNIIIGCLLLWLFFYPEPETPAKVEELKGKLEAVEKLYHQQVRELDSISQLFSAQQWVIDSLRKKEEVIKQTISDHEENYTRLDRVSDSTDMLADLRFLSGN